MGTVCFFLGAYLCYDFIYLPLELARQHVPEIDYSLKAFFIGPICTCLGIAVLGMAILVPEEKLIAMRDSPQARSLRTPQKTLKLAGIVLLVLGPIALLYWWFSTEMSAMGYDVGF
jgi:hypothetical protein